MRQHKVGTIVFAFCPCVYMRRFRANTHAQEWPRMEKILENCRDLQDLSPATVTPHTHTVQGSHAFQVVTLFVLDHSPAM